MENENKTDPYEDNRDLSRQSPQSMKKESQASSIHRHKKSLRDKNHNEDEKGTSTHGRSKNRNWNSDTVQDQISDEEGRKSKESSFHPEDYENDFHSERSFSPYSRSRTPSPTPQSGVRPKMLSNSPVHKIGGVGLRNMARIKRPGGHPLTQQQRRGVHLQNKESTPPKNPDLVTKRMLSGRLLKINELRNALVELQQRADELQKENRILRLLQVRQEKALQRYNNTESEISQLLLRHSNETHVLRERLRRSQERERAVERRLKDSEEQLLRSQVTIARLKKLVNQQELGARDELCRKLEEEKARSQEAEQKLKDLERSMELSNSSYQRQLVAEKKKTLGARVEIKALQEELDRLNNKLKEKERELDTKNIYANRMGKTSQKKDGDNGAKQKVPSRNSAKAVQTEDRTPSVDFPTPPPAITDANKNSEPSPDEYLSLKELNKVVKKVETDDRPPSWEEKRREKEIEREKEKEHEDSQEKIKQEQNVLEEKPKRLRDGMEKEKVEEDRKQTSPQLKHKEEESYMRSSHVQVEVERWNQETQASQKAAEEACCKKELLLAKMREIDKHQAAQGSTFPKPSSEFDIIGDHSTLQPPEQRSRNPLIFSLTETEESSNRNRRLGMEGEAVAAVVNRRMIHSQSSSDDLAFGGYAPSFGSSSSRASSGYPPPPSTEDRNPALEAIKILNLRGMEAEEDKDTEKGAGRDKFSLMQQLFGAQPTPAGDTRSKSNKMEVLGSPPTADGVRSRREGLFSFNSGSSPPPPSSNMLHITHSKPTIRAMASFEDDIEELTF
ncbi:lebercilin [Pholidichthys leucotaenia]